MSLLFILTRLGFPIMIAVGGIAAWRMAKADNAPGADKPAWKDDSLDEWRKERDEREASSRAERTDAARAELDAAIADRTHDGTTEERETTKKHQRIGG